MGERIIEKNKKRTSELYLASVNLEHISKLNDRNLRTRLINQFILFES